ncbi:uncharacterized protein [Ptychodera flava]|uniref:uncharacterized protein isoform X2 n=1 Tax=Ptychodera flava TaxID=63121 RepID=UPI00396A3953
MGAELSHPKELKNQQSVLIQTINLLHIHSIKKAYFDIKAYKISTSFVDRNRFVQCLDLDENVTAKLLSAFDRDGDGVINWRECLAGLSLCVNGSLREKSTALFKLFKVPSDRGITPAALQNLLTVSLDAALRIYNCDLSNGNGFGTVLLNTEAIVSDIVREIYQSTEYTQDGRLYLTGFQKFVESNPRIPSSMFKYENNKLQKKLNLEETSQPELVFQQTRNKSTVISNKGAEKLSPTPPAIQTHIWTNIFPEKVRTPYTRSKHAACLQDSCVYVYGGRDVNTTLKDLWKFDINSNVWTLLKCSGDVPPALQEHSMVPYKDNIYIFGGEFGFGSCDETPLWIFNVEKKHWTKHSVDSEVRMPSSRRGHTAVVHNGAMHVYGGYVDLKGSTNEFWTYDFESCSWHLNYSPQVESMPAARHCHIATVHDNAMWIYGGLANLTVKGDVWKWSFDSRKWSRIRYRQGPGDLHGHSVVKVTDGMLIFGGADGDGNVRNDLWKFYFDTHTWQKIVCHNQLSPTPRSRHVAIAVATPVHLSPKSPRAHSVPNLRNRHKPSMTAIVEESSEKLQRPYSSPPSFQMQETHYFKTRVYPMSSGDPIQMDVGEGYQNASFIDDKGSDSTSIQTDFMVTVDETEAEKDTIDVLCEAVDDKTLLIDLEQPSLDVKIEQIVSRVQLMSSRTASAQSERLQSGIMDAISSNGNSQCNSHSFSDFSVTDLGEGDATQQTKRQIFPRKSSKPENMPLPGLVKEDGDKSLYQEEIIPNVTEIDESDRVDISDKIKLLESDSELDSVRSSIPDQSHDILNQSEQRIRQQTNGTCQLNSWLEGLSQNSIQSETGSHVETSSSLSGVKTENVMKYSHNASTPEQTRPKLHGRSRTLPLVPVSLETIQNIQEKQNFPRTDHFIVAGKETDEDDDNANVSLEVSMFFILGGKEQDTNVLDQYTMPLDVWRCDIMPGKPTSQQIQRLMMERHG